MPVESISAVTLSVKDMARSVVFYRDLVGLNMLYGGESAGFTSFGIGGGYLNLIATDQPVGWWGRVIFYVDDVDELHAQLVSQGLKSDTDPADAPWGERYFHIFDPDGHELSFARPLEKQ
ncbi:MAG: VOC family protein [Chloroflexi bacterium]|nr:VOC family protein [Chloroflexota bacterium]